MKKTITILFLLVIQLGFGQVITAEAKIINQYLIIPDKEPEFIGASNSENKYIFNLTEKIAFENPEDKEKPIAIKDYRKIENGNYVLIIENDEGKKDIQLLIDFTEKKLVFQFEADKKMEIKAEYILEELEIN